MTRLSITKAWDEAADILRRDFGTLFAVALALIALPNFAVQALAAGPIARAGPGAAPLALLLFLVALVPILAGTLAVSALALGRERVVRAAIAHGFRRSPALLGAVLLTLIVAFLILIPLILASGVTAEQLAARSPDAMRRVGLAMGVALILFILLGAKLILVAPAAAAEPLGPLATLRRSWTLTRGHFWKLLGFNLLVTLAYIVVALALTAVFGILLTLLMGRPEPGTLAALLLQLVGTLAGCAFTTILATLVARIYVQLAGGATTGS